MNRHGDKNSAQGAADLFPEFSLNLEVEPPTCTGLLNL